MNSKMKMRELNNDIVLYLTINEKDDKYIKYGLKIF